MASSAGPEPANVRKEYSLHRRTWLSIVVTAVGAGLLVAAGVAAPSAKSKSGAAALSGAQAWRDPARQHRRH